MGGDPKTINGLGTHFSSSFINLIILHQSHSLSYHHLSSHLSFLLDGIGDLMLTLYLEI